MANALFINTRCVGVTSVWRCQGLSGHSLDASFHNIPFFTLKQWSVISDKFECSLLVHRFREASSSFIITKLSIVCETHMPFIWPIGHIDDGAKDLGWTATRPKIIVLQQSVERTTTKKQTNNQILWWKNSASPAFIISPWPQFIQLSCFLYCVAYAFMCSCAFPLYIRCLLLLSSHRYGLRDMFLLLLLLLCSCYDVCSLF